MNLLTYIIEDCVVEKWKGKGQNGSDDGDYQSGNGAASRSASSHSLPTTCFFLKVEKAKKNEPLRRRSNGRLSFEQLDYTVRYAFCSRSK